MNSFSMIDALFLMAARGDQLRDFPQHLGPHPGLRKRPLRAPSLPLPLWHLR